MFSQRNEEKYILRFFKDKIGRFLDIGAYDGKCFSNTHQLALNGWGGICIEPSPTVLPALNKLYETNPKVDILPIAISEVSGKRIFYDSGGDAISSFDKDHVELWEMKGAKNFTEIEVMSYTVKELFNCFISYDFDFVNIDVEGLSLFVLKELPLHNLPKVKMICVEFDHDTGSIMAVVEQHGFTLLYQTAENMILVR